VMHSLEGDAPDGHPVSLLDGDDQGTGRGPQRDRCRPRGDRSTATRMRTVTCSPLCLRGCRPAAMSRTIRAALVRHRYVPTNAPECQGETPHNFPKTVDSESFGVSFRLTHSGPRDRSRIRAGAWPKGSAVGRRR
jgi:hypothetical protein